MPEENKNLEKSIIRRKIFKWGGIFLIAIVFLTPIFFYTIIKLADTFKFMGGMAIVAVLGLLFLSFYGPAILLLGVILILIERILRKPPLTEIIILLLIIFILIIIIFILHLYSLGFSIPFD